MRPTRLRLLLTVAIAATCLLFALRGIHAGALADALVSAHPAALVAALIGLLGTFLLRSLRYHLLLDGAARLTDVVLASAVGFFTLQTLPFRLGEFVRPYLLTEAGVDWGRALGAIVVERLLDLLVLLAMITWVSRIDMPPIQIRGVDVLAVARGAAFVSAGGLAAALLVLVALGDAVAARLPQRLAGPVRGAATSVRAVRPSRLASGGLLSAGIWACNVFTVASVLHALSGLPRDLDVALTVCTATVATVLAVPTPGMVGSFEAGVRAGLDLWGVPAADATAAALTWHGLTFLFHAGVGLIGFFALGLSMTEVVARSRRT